MALRSMFRHPQKRRGLWEAHKAQEPTRVEQQRLWRVQSFPLDPVLELQCLHLQFPPECLSLPTPKTPHQPLLLLVALTWITTCLLLHLHLLPCLLIFLLLLIISFHQPPISLLPLSLSSCHPPIPLPLPLRLLILPPSIPLQAFLTAYPLLHPHHH